MKRNILPESLECKLTPELLDSFDKAADGSMRMLQVVVNDKKALALAKSKETKSGSNDWKVNFNNYISEAVDLSSPSFIFYRLDETNKATNQYLWLLISWSPDCVTNKIRTIYALCKSTLIHQFSGGQIKDNIFASDKSELTLESYIEYISEPKPVSEAEKGLKYAHDKENEARNEHQANFKILPGLNFPVDSQVLRQLNLFKLERCNYMQLIIDQKGEKIMLESSCDKLDIASLQSKIPLDSARFHIYRFSHIFEDLPYKSLVFIYSMSDVCTPVKERMIYSSCKSELISFLKTQHICPIKALEVSDPSELTKQLLIEELHPKKYVIMKRDGSCDPASSPTSRPNLRRVTFHEDAKADDSWINDEVKQEMEARKRRALAPRPKPKELQLTKAPLVLEETLFDSLVNSIMHNNLFHVMFLGMLALSFCIFGLRLLRSFFYYV